jgi:hypothetical protein
MQRWNCPLPGGCISHNRGAKRVELTGVALNIIGLDDLKTNKRAAGRLKDLAELESLDPPDRCG